MVKVFCARCARAGEVERPNDWSEPAGWLVVDTPELWTDNERRAKGPQLVRLCTGCTARLVANWLQNLDPATVRRLAKGALATHLLRMALE